MTEEQVRLVLQLTGRQSIQEATNDLRQMADVIEDIQGTGGGSKGGKSGGGFAGLSSAISRFGQDAAQGIAMPGDAMQKLNSAVLATGNNLEQLLGAAGFGGLGAILATIGYTLLPLVLKGLQQAFSGEEVTQYRDKIDELKGSIEELEKKKIKTEFDWTEIDRMKEELAGLERRKKALETVEGGADKATKDEQAKLAAFIGERGSANVLNQLTELMPGADRLRKAEEGGATPGTRAWRKRIRKEAAEIIEAAQGKIGTIEGQRQARGFMVETGVYDPFAETPEGRRKRIAAEDAEKAKAAEAENRRSKAGDKAMWSSVFGEIDEFGRETDAVKARHRREAGQANTEWNRDAGENRAREKALMRSILESDPGMATNIQQGLFQGGNTPDAMARMQGMLSQHLQGKGMEAPQAGVMAAKIVGEQSNVLQNAFDRNLSMTGNVQEANLATAAMLTERVNALTDQMGRVLQGYGTIQREIERRNPVMQNRGGGN